MAVRTSSVNTQPASLSLFALAKPSGQDAPVDGAPGPASFGNLLNQEGVGQESGNPPTFLEAPQPAPAEDAHSKRDEEQPAYALPLTLQQSEPQQIPGSFASFNSAANGVAHEGEDDDADQEWLEDSFALGGASSSMTSIQPGVEGVDGKGAQISSELELRQAGTPSAADVSAGAPLRSEQVQPLPQPSGQHENEDRGAKSLRSKAAPQDVVRSDSGASELNGAPAHSKGKSEARGLVEHPEQSSDTVRATAAASGKSAARPLSGDRIPAEAATPVAPVPVQEHDALGQKPLEPAGASPDVQGKFVVENPAGAGAAPKAGDPPTHVDRPLEESSERPISDGLKQDTGELSQESGAGEEEHAPAGESPKKLRRPDSFSPDLQKTEVHGEKSASAPVEVRVADAAPASAVDRRPLADAPRVTPEEIIQQVKLNMRTGTSRINFMVDPPELGRLAIRLVLRRGRLTGEITAHSGEVRQALAQGLDGLKETMRAAGVHVDSLQVRSEGEAPQTFQQETRAGDDGRQPGSSGYREERRGTVHGADSADSKRIINDASDGNINVMA